MITLVIDEGMIIALAVPFVIVVFVALFVYCMDLKVELDSMRIRAETWEELSHDYRDKMIMWKQKYEKLQKETEEQEE